MRKKLFECTLIKATECSDDRTLCLAFAASLLMVKSKLSQLRRKWKVLCSDKQAKGKLLAARPNFTPKLF